MTTNDSLLEFLWHKVLVRIGWHPEAIPLEHLLPPGAPPDRLPLLKYGVIWSRSRKRSRGSWSRPA